MRSRKRSGANITCKHCGTWFYVKPSEIAGGRKFCSRKCSDAFKVGRVSPSRRGHYRNCLVCEKRFYTIPSQIRKGGGKYCSNKCVGVANALRDSTVAKTCESCGIAYKVKPSEAKGSRYCSFECRKSKSILVCQWCGEPYEVHGYRKDTSRFCSYACKGAWTTKNTHSPTAIEEAVAKMLDSLGVEYESQKQMGRFVCDFFVPGCGLVIEADGVYWHSKPKVIERDKRKNKWLKKRGYNILRLRGDDIRERPEWCVEQIINHLESP